MARSEERKPTIREVAKLARVGLMTVSRVINNHPSVRPSTRRKVEAAIASLGYQQNEAARQLKGRRAKMIGLIVPDLSDSFFAVCAHTVQHIARAYGYMTLIVASERDADLELQEAELMASRMVSGLLVVTSTRDGDERLRRLQNADFPIVAFDRPLRGLDTDSVVVENRAGAERAVAHLIGHGHRSIACLGGREEVYTIDERVLGYTNTMHSAGLKPLIMRDLSSLDEVNAWLDARLARKNPPTAIFAVNHQMSVLLLRAFKERGLRVPQDIALIGFDDFELAEVWSPPLTTVGQSASELSRRAMGLLLSRIQGVEDRTEFSPAQIVLPAKLIVRSSCGTHEPLHPEDQRSQKSQSA